MTDLVLDHPFFAALVLRTKRIEDNSGGVTMYTDGNSIWYGPDFINEIGRSCTLGVFAHEALHIFLKHHIRKGTRDNRVWNIACDAVINAILIDSRFKLPKGGVEPIRCKTAEQVYDDIIKQEQDRKEDGEQEQPDKGQPSDKGNDKGQPSDKPSLEPHQTKPCPWGSVEQQEGLETEAGRERAEQECNVLIKQAATAAKRAGKLPLGLQLEIDRITEPRVDWKEVLAKFIGERAKSDYSWAYPNPRYFSRGIILPSLHSYGIGKIVMACDTSGSMLDTVRDVCSEVVGALEVYEDQGQSPEVSVLWCDTKVHEQTIADASDLKPEGGGGTDFAPVFDAVRARHEDAKAVVYITDGHCNSFGQEPACPVLWVLTEDNYRFKPPFGEVITISSQHNS